MFKCKKIALLLIYSALVLLFLSLAFWQIQRFQFKLELNNNVAESEEITDEKQFINFPYKLANVGGEFIKKYIFVYKTFGDSLAKQPVSLRMLLMPFRLNGGKIILLSPGWLLKENIDEIPPQLFTRKYNISARILPNEKKPLFINSYSPNENLWLVADLPAISKVIASEIKQVEIETAYYLIAADTNAHFNGIFNQIKLSNIRNLNIYHHLGYAITWLGFALVVVVMGRYSMK
ncbi:MAG: SURF1 family protein [Rickettsiaceae bacterium]|nr:SURF1 family protein [Rickettsiaceae bacterium]